MYSFRNLLQQEPTAISACLIATLNIFVLAGIWALSKEVVLALNTSLVLWLGLFYARPLTISKSSLQELEDAAAAKPARKNA